MGKEKECNKTRQYDKPKHKCMHLNKCLCVDKITVKHRLTTDCLNCCKELKTACLDCKGNAQVKCLSCCDAQVKCLNCCEKARVGCLNVNGALNAESLEVCDEASVKNFNVCDDTETKNLKVCGNLQLREVKVNEEMTVECLRVKGQTRANSVEVTKKLLTEKLLVQEDATAGSLNVSSNAMLDTVYYPRAWGQITNFDSEPVSTSTLNSNTGIDNNVWVSVPVSTVTLDPNSELFTLVPPNQLMYIGLTSRQFNAQASVTLTVDDGTGTSTFDGAIFRNGLLVLGSVVSLTLQSTGLTVNSTRINKILRMDTNDYLELYIQRTSGDSDVSVTFNLSVEGLPNLVV